MQYLSVCSGIEAASVAWHGLGWKPVAFAEVDPFPSAVLKHRFPETPNLGDITRYRNWRLNDCPRLLVGGTPCQSFSVAGLRRGMDDPRGNLALTYLGMVDRFRPDWCVWENVPGVLSSSGGRDFGAFLGGLAELGYGWAYRVIDAQYVRTCGHPYAVPQRRRRVFVVGHPDPRRARAVLFDAESLRGNPPPRRQAGQGIATTLASRTRGGGGLGTDFDCDGGLITSTGQVSHCLNAGAMGRIDYETETLVAHALRGEGFDASEDGTGRGTPLAPIAFQANASGANLHPTFGIAGTLKAGNNGTGNGQAIAIQERAVCENPDAGPDGAGFRTDGAAYTMEAPSVPQSVATPYAVRRLTPVECERLQGFPDGWTDIPWRGKPGAPDGPRYKAIGNSMAVNVMRWIGERIALVDIIP